MSQQTMRRTAESRRSRGRESPEIEWQSRDDKLGPYEGDVECR